MTEAITPLFTDLGLSPALLQALHDVGYESPSPIQSATIPLLLANRDLLGQAQTGTGKTAAFALPILSRLDLKQTVPQALVLVPTRELAIQVAEAFQRYAAHIPGFHVLPIYGGASYGPQLSSLKRGVHVVVGTPGRVIDHLDKGTLDLSKLKTLVLDEADEMLRMGFIDDVERILQDTPKTRQTALFSATMPSAIKRIAQTQLQNPAEIMVAAKTGTADNIRQRYWLVSGMHKLDALTRLLEAEDYDGIIVFARTKLATEELAVKLMARGFSAAAINGDMQQQHRERTVGQLKDGSIDILVATDVAARGLDVDRISHVINYDVPSDPESYTHRIGRTGRAGRSGEAILFITPRERSLLKSIERSTRQPISQLELPTITTVNNVRIARFKEQISQTLADGDLDVFAAIIEAYENEHNVPAIEIAAALAKMSRGGVPLLLARPERGAKSGPDAPGPVSFSPVSSSPVSPFQADRSDDRPARAARKSAPPFERPARTEPAPAVSSAPVSSAPVSSPALSSPDSPPPSTWRDRASQAAHEPIDAKPARLGSQAYRIEIGHIHGVKPGNIVGAIANETGLEAKHIGRIEIFDTYSLIELSAGLPKKTLKHLQTVRVGSQPLRISESDVMPRPAVKRPRKPS